MRFNALALASVVTLAVAAPTKNVFNDVYTRSSSLEEFYSRVGNYINQFAGDVASATCDMSKVQLPAAASQLPTPNGTLKYVAIGRGTQVRQKQLPSPLRSSCNLQYSQNYTCANLDRLGILGGVGAGVILGIL